MVLSVVFMGSSADRSAGDVALPVCAGELTVEGNGVPGTATVWYPKAPGFIKGAFVNSETAGMLECMFHKNTDSNWNYMSRTHLQTEQHWPDEINRLCYPIAPGDQISARGDNAGAVMDLLMLWVDNGKGGEVPVLVPNKPLPAGAILAHGISTFTSIADSVAEGTITWDDFTPERDVHYDIIALAMDSATGLGGRLHFRDGPNKEDYPGVPVVDTEAAGSQLNALWYGNFGSFIGQTPPLVQQVAVAADAQVCITMVLVPRGGR